MDVDRHAHGTPSWVDYTTDDVDAAAEFYGGLFGWKTERDPRPEAGGYAMCTVRDRPVAALSPPPPGATGHGWSAYITVDDADATTKAIEAAGGSVIAPPFDVLDAGRMAAVTDTEGARFAIWEAKAAIGTGIIDEPGTLAWLQLDDATDGARAKRFYRDVFGWDADDADYVSFSLAGRPIAGMAEPYADGDTGMASWLVYFHVSDRDAAHKRIEELGGRVAYVNDELDFVYALDPQGKPFCAIAGWKSAS